MCSVYAAPPLFFAFFAALLSRTLPLKTKIKPVADVRSTRECHM